ncbi:hypothetical protein K1W54_08550 [Micromonospora sp. CPCC 205371]|nr:hypothetical protein [Micromonospora sp. CPCC 205371]
MNSRHPMPNIGIVTALPVEAFAVQTILEDLEEAPDTHHEDRSIYYLGGLPSRVPGQPHGVVLCLLTEDGGVAAAHGCANLARTWNVRYIIMCGIACGVPNTAEPERHVRLGDVLVAEDGIVPYGHVRVDDEGDHLRRPAARPSVDLRNAARKLRTTAEAGHRPWEKWLDVGRRPDLAAYARPPAVTDMLLDDETGQQIRHPTLGRSGHLPGRPKVHHGLIGSGGKLIRTSQERNRLARKHRLIGLDMEGDGVSDAAYLQGVDWFMVRGVSDYGSPKNDTWHRYAALAAAAYTRALLEQVKPSAARRTQPVFGTELGERRDRPVPNRDVLVAALLEVRTMRDRIGRDSIHSALPDVQRNQVRRAHDAYHDVCGFVDSLGPSSGGLTQLLEALRAAEGDSLPVRRFAALLQDR